MSSRDYNSIYALKNNEIISIADVESGLKCGCICPACGEPLIAKKGQKKMYHFAHYHTHNCEYGYESSLHLAAKSILSKAQRFTIPTVKLTFPNSYRGVEMISEAKEIKIDEVSLEKRYGGIIPDIVIRSGKKELFVEIFVTHKIDDNKLAQLKETNISAIEIDLSKKDHSMSEEELTHILLNDSEEKKWVYNATIESWKEKYYNICDKKLLTTYSECPFDVKNCPIKKKTWKKQYYADSFYDCLECKYCLGLEDGYVLCLGEERISSIKDFDIPKEKRIKESDEHINNIRNEKLSKGHCPDCGAKLVLKNSQYGEFLGCKSYPRCVFTHRISSRKCPICGGELIKRKNKYNERFWGCSNFPECKFTCVCIYFDEK